MKKMVRYSEAFKQQVVRELGEGKFPSICAAARAYGIRGSMTIHKWLRGYGRTDLLAKVVRVETAKEVSQLKQLRQRVRDLEKALADAHLDHKLAEAYLHLACEAGGIEDVDAFKTKHGGQR